MARNVDRGIKEYEDKVKVIGYYCSTCQKDWVLQNWNGNIVPNDTARKLQNDHRLQHNCVSHLTRQDNGGRFVKYVCQRCDTEWKLEKVTEVPGERNDGIIGYMCSACEKEWLVDGVQGVDENMQNLRRHRHSRTSYVNVRQHGETFKRRSWVCADCKKEWLLSCSYGSGGQNLSEILNRHHSKQGCKSEVEHKSDIRVKQYVCTSEKCSEKWILKEISLDNHELLRRLRKMKALWDHHRVTGCLGAVQFLSRKDHEEYGLEAGANNIIGYYCTDCKKEWLPDEWNRNPAPIIEDKVVDHHYVPTFKHLRISDTGTRVYWDEVQHKLQEGDHIAWQRLLTYWHHAIVEKVDGREVTVIEWTSHFCWKKICCCLYRPSFQAGIHRTPMDMSGCCGERIDSPMYKVVYPEEVQMQNPPELVLSRAHSRLCNTGYSIARDNCEHFATFCKTGVHKCGQISQKQLTCQAWGVKRLVIALAYVIFLISFAEMVEEIFGKGKDYVGLGIIGIVEFFCAVCKIRCVYYKDTPRENFTKEGYSRCTTACRYAVLKIIAKSIFMCVGTLLITVFLIDSDHIKNVKKEWRPMAEIVLSLVGGLGGSAIGFLLADWLTLCSSCCRDCYRGVLVAGDLCGRVIRFLLECCSILICWCSSCCRGQAHHEDSQCRLQDVEQNYNSINT